MSSVVVTGAAKGIGAGIVQAFAGAGWSVVAVDRAGNKRRVSGTFVIQ